MRVNFYCFSLIFTIVVTFLLFVVKFYSFCWFLLFFVNFHYFRSFTAIDDHRANLEPVTAKKNLPERQNHNHNEHTEVLKVLILVVKFKFVPRISIPKNLSVKIHILSLSTITWVYQRLSTLTNGISGTIFMEICHTIQVVLCFTGVTHVLPRIQAGTTLNINFQTLLSVSMIVKNYDGYKHFACPS